MIGREEIKKHSREEIKNHKSTAFSKRHDVEFTLPDNDMMQEHNPKKYKKYFNSKALMLPVAKDDISYIEIHFKQGTSFTLAKDQFIKMFEQYFGDTL